MLRRLVLLTVSLAGCHFHPVPPSHPAAQPDGGFPFFPDGGIFCGQQGTDLNAVVAPASEPPPISGGTMAVMADGTAVIGDSDRDLIYIVRPSATAPETIPLNAHDEPGRVIAGSGNRAFVVLRGAAQVAEVDLQSATLHARHAVCPSPRGIAFDNTLLYVACATGELQELTYANTGLTLANSINLGDDLRDVVLLSDGVIVSTFRNATLFKVFPSGQIQSLTQPFVGFEMATRVGWRLVASGDNAWLVHQGARTSTIVDGECAGSTYGSQDKAAVRSRLSQVYADGHSTDLEMLHDLTEVLPVDVAISQAGGFAIAAAGSQMLISSTAPDLSVPGITSVAWFGSALFVFTREPANLTVYANIEAQDVTPTRFVHLNDTSVKSTGHDLFHLATPAQLACASCHPEGGDDGHVWSFPEGARRTPSLRGGLSGTAPFHWVGDEADMSALVQDVMVHRMGGAEQPATHVNALLHWLDAQPKRTPPVLDAAAVARGQALFESAQTGCTTCHTGVEGTNNTTVDVGTGEAFQVPRLVELAFRAPFMHDGRARSLSERFGGEGGGEAHGHTAALTPAELSDLTTYLLSR